MADTAVKDVVEVVAVEKEGFGTKIKNTAKKVWSSKPAKIVGGILLAAGGAVAGYAFGRSGSEDYDDEEYFEDDVIEEDIPDEMVND